MSETEYFGQVDMGQRVFALYRKRPYDGILYQEKWMPLTSTWERTTFLMRLLIGGDCTLEQITIQMAKRAYPLAFCVDPLDNLEKA